MALPTCLILTRLFFNQRSTQNTEYVQVHKYCACFEINLAFFIFFLVTLCTIDQQTWRAKNVSIVWRLCFSFKHVKLKFLLKFAKIRPWQSTPTIDWQMEKNLRRRKQTLVPKSKSIFKKSKVISMVSVIPNSLIYHFIYYNHWV